MRHVDTPEGAVAIAAEILARRTKQLVLISTDYEGRFVFDTERIERELAGEADVVTIVHGPATYALGDELPDKANLHSGAARSYPADFGSDPDWRRSILRFPDRHTDAELIEDALAQVTFASNLEPVVRREWVRGVVERVSGQTGNVAKLSNGGLAAIVGHNLPPAISLTDALVAGGPVEGWLIDRDLAPEAAEVDYSRFADGDTTLARVVKVTAARAKLVLHPADSAGIDLRKRDVIPGVDDGQNADIAVSDVVRRGQTVRVRVVRTATTLGLSLVDVDQDAELVEPHALLEGGVPWLREGVDAQEEFSEQTAAVADQTPATTGADGLQPVSQTPSSPGSVDAPSAGALIEIRDELSGLRGAFARLSRELRAGTDLETLDQLKDESAGLTAELQRERGLRRERDTMISSLRLELRDARAQRGTAAESRRTSRDAWPDEVAWFRFELLATWAARTIASEKAQHPLGEYVIGRRFVQSLLALDEGQLEKTLRTTVDVLTGRAAQIPGRQLHRLREGQGGDDPYVIRDDGAVCWRASIEINAASARRLHYWQAPGKPIELSRVVLHDDFEP